MDTEKTVIYADPPYYTGGHVYQNGIGGQEWRDGDFDELWEMLRSFEHAHIIVSIDRDDVLPGWHITPVERYNSMSRHNRSRKTEFVIRNYKRTSTRDMSRNESLLRWTR